MTDAALETRVRILEQKVGELAVLPARLERLEEQILQLRQEIRDGFSATTDGLRAEIRAGDEETRRYMRVLYEDLIERIERMGEGYRRPKR